LVFNGGGNEEQISKARVNHALAGRAYMIACRQYADACAEADLDSKEEQDVSRVPRP